MQLPAFLKNECLEQSASANACKQMVQRLLSKAKGLLPKAFGQQPIPKLGKSWHWVILTVWEGLQLGAEPQVQ